MRLAVLDLGSSSFRLLVVDVTAAGSLHRLHADREMLNLGAAVGRFGHVPDDVADEAVAAVTRFRRAADDHRADRVVPIATAALRDSTNGTHLLDRLSTAAGVPVRLIDGTEEARLAFAGMRASVSIRPSTVLALDLGGGSLDLAVGTATDITWAASLPLGVSRLAGELVRSDPLDRDDRASLKRRVRAHLARVHDPLQGAAAGRAITIGGTARTLTRMVGHERWGSLPPSINQMEVGLEELRALTKRLCSSTRDERLEMPGMDERRVDYLPAGAVILSTVLADLGYQTMTVSEWGLREGVAFHEVGLDGSAEGLRRTQVERLRGSGDHSHADRVAVLAVQLFDDTQELHQMGMGDRELLEHASALHDLGTRVEVDDQHKHGASLLQRAALRGFAPEEIATLASLVRYQRGSVKPSRPPLSLLDEAARHRVTGLVAMLRLAHGLDDARAGAVTRVAADVRDGVLVLDVDGPGPFSRALSQAGRQLQTLQDALGLPVEIRAPHELPAIA